MASAANIAMFRHLWTPDEATKPEDLEFGENILVREGMVMRRLRNLMRKMVEALYERCQEIIIAGFTLLVSAIM